MDDMMPLIILLIDAGSEPLAISITIILIECTSSLCEKGLSWLVISSHLNYYVLIFLSSISEWHFDYRPLNSCLLTPSTESGTATTDSTDNIFDDFVGDESLKLVLPKISALLQSFVSSSSSNKSLPAGQFLTSLVSLVISASLPFRLPSLFFTRRQSTSIRLVLLPSGVGSNGEGEGQSTAAGTASSLPTIVVARHETGLVLQVMGIVSQRAASTKNSMLIRRIIATDLLLSISQVRWPL